ncbi:MAG: thermonuclease family protein [Planctomycetota bacterium]
MNRPHCWALLAALSLASLTQAANDPDIIHGLVTGVSDGDTCRVRLDDGREVRIRFYGVDTPEHAFPGNWGEQPHADRAEQFTNGLLYGEKVTVRMRMRVVDGELKWQKTGSRFVGEVFICGQSVSRLIVRHGHGWWFKGFAEDDEDLQELAAAAKREKRGLWVTGQAVAPARWRSEGMGR